MDCGDVRVLPDHNILQSLAACALAEETKGSHLDQPVESSDEAGPPPAMGNGSPVRGSGVAAVSGLHEGSSFVVM